MIRLILIIAVIYFLYTVVKIFLRINSRRGDTQNPNVRGGGHNFFNRNKTKNVTKETKRDIEDADFEEIK